MKTNIVNNVVSVTGRWGQRPDEGEFQISRFSVDNRFSEYIVFQNLPFGCKLRKDKKNSQVWIWHWQLTVEAQ